MEYCIIGVGRFGATVATQLQENGHNVLAIDTDSQRLKEIADEVSYTMILDATDERALKEVSIEHFDAVVVGMGERSMTSSLLICLNLQNLGVKKIYVKATSDSHYKILNRIGMENIIMPERDMGKRVAMKIQNNALLDYIEISDDVRIEGFRINGYLKKYIGKSIIEINLRKNYNINIVCIKRNGELIIPESNTVINECDMLIIVGTQEKLDKFEKVIAKEK